MNILVTGGCGFIGSTFVKEMHAYGDSIICFDRFSYAGRIERFDSYVLNSGRVKFMFGDLASPITDWQMEKIGDIDYIVHFAAETMVDQSIKLPYPFIISNYFGMYHLLEYARKLKNLKKLVVISTDEVYGPILEGNFKESDKLNPTNPYSATKAGADLLANSYFHSFETPIVTIRTANNFGEFQHAEKMIPTIIRNCMNETPQIVYGDGKHRRCWLYASDFAKGIKTVLDNGKIGETYNLAGDEELENLELIKKIESILYVGTGKKLLLKHIPDNDIRRGHDRRYGIDDS